MRYSVVLSVLLLFWPMSVLAQEKRQQNSRRNVPQKYSHPHPRSCWASPLINGRESQGRGVGDYRVIDLHFRVLVENVCLQNQIVQVMLSGAHSQDAVVVHLVYGHSYVRDQRYRFFREQHRLAFGEPLYIGARYGSDLRLYLYKAGEGQIEVEMDFLSSQRSDY